MDIFNIMNASKDGRKITISTFDLIDCLTELQNNISISKEKSIEDNHYISSQTFEEYEKELEIVIQKLRNKIK